MISPLIIKLQNCQDKSKLESIYKDILIEYENLNFPNQEFKSKSKYLVTDSIEVFIKEFDSDMLRESNKRTLESLKLFDNL
ncbi:hypothetical protein H7F37_03070 [Winogradskyella sp. PAMC22761]|nr:hypothetical protein H7F37_03070 [Winogradskyella sp. PAMC22761]